MVVGNDVIFSKTFSPGDLSFPGPIKVTDSSLTLSAGTAGIKVGGDSLNYAYAWSNGIPATAGPHTVCPTTTTTYSVTVTDGSPAPPASAG